jgi:ferric-dicitrate binding protein FerR (iron transport regulator)
MKSRYEILKKHFNKETSSEEENLVSAFIQENPQEYQLLKHLWWSNTKVQIRNFDSNAGWEKVVAQANRRNRKSTPIHTKLQRIAAIMIILIISSLFIYHLINTGRTPNRIVAVTCQTKKGNEIVLSDGSKIWLNKNSKCTYPENFKGKIRKVSLTGEAFFEIAKNPNKPFIIETDNADVTVLGTAFNINTNILQTTISVTTGIVKVESKFSNECVTLLPENMAKATKTNLQKSEITNLNYLSWKTGLFVFKDTPLSIVVHDLNTFYDKQIALYRNDTEQRFTARFDNSKQKDIIEILKLTYKLTIEENINIYEIH